MIKEIPTGVDKTTKVPYNTQVIRKTPMNDEMLTRCVVDPLARKFYLYSSLGTERQVSCETVNQFMNVLELVRSLLDEDTLAYSNPL
jgi:hypothetical protein